MNRIALFGYSGHAYVIADAILEMGGEIIGYYDRSEANLNPFNLEYFGDEQEQSSMAKLNVLGVPYFVGIGDNKIRKRLSDQLIERGYVSTLVIHPKSIVSKLADINSGTFVAAGAMINAMANVGKGAIINTGAIVEHECEVGDYAHIAPGAVLAGNVQVGEGSFIGANAVVKQGVHIGKYVVIGAGAVVLNNVLDNQVVVGNPGRIIK